MHACVFAHAQMRGHSFLFLSGTPSQTHTLTHTLTRRSFLLLDIQCVEIVHTLPTPTDEDGGGHEFACTKNSPAGVIHVVKCVSTVSHKDTHTHPLTNTQTHPHTHTHIHTHTHTHTHSLSFSLSLSLTHTHTTTHTHTRTRTHTHKHTHTHTQTHKHI